MTPEAASLRRRPSARLLVLDPDLSLLLFRFVHKDGPTAGADFWATPGGGVEPGESLPETATTAATVGPENLPGMLRAARCW